MAKNTENRLDATERRELEKLNCQVEKLSLENARLLAGHASEKETESGAINLGGANPS